MFYTEEDVTPVVRTAERVFGKQNLYFPGSQYKYCTLITREFGKIWVGELNLSDRADTQQKLNLLSDTLDKRIFITNGDYSINQPIMKSNTKLRDGSEFMT